VAGRFYKRINFFLKKESEARLDILRARSSKSGSSSKLVEYDQFLNQGHVNLFEQEELGVSFWNFYISEDFCLFW
jgi:hypothetical protein